MKYRLSLEGTESSELRGRAGLLTLLEEELRTAGNLETKSGKEGCRSQQVRMRDAELSVDAQMN